MTENFFAQRGSRVLDENEFKSHMALAVRLENIAVLLGAGASKCVGGQIMSEIWSVFNTSCDSDVSWLCDENFFGKSESPNIEHLLDKLEIACRDAQRRQEDLSQLLQTRHNLRKFIIQAALLDNELWMHPDNSAIYTKFSNHLKFLSRLVANRQPGQASPWLFTTNYDLSVEWSSETLGLHCVNGFSGLHNRAFRPSSFDLGLRNVHARGEARFGTYNVYLAKLHGSLSWVVEDDGGIVELPSRAIKSRIDSFLSSSEPDDWPGFLIFPGATKYVQSTGFVYGEMVRRFTELLTKPNSCLIVNGYGFADDHINRLIVSALQNPTLQIIIYLHNRNQFENCKPVSSLGAHVDSNEQLRHLIYAQLPQITLRGFGDRANFSSLADDLPDPALIDDTSERARLIEQLLKQATNVSTAKQDSSNRLESEHEENDLASTVRSSK